MRISALLLDFDHTLGIDHHLELDVLRAFAHERCNRTPSDADLLATLTEYRTGKTSMEEALREGFARWGYRSENPSLLSKEFRALVLAEAPKRVEATPGTPDFLRALDAKGIPHGVLTNGWTELQLLKARLIGYRGPLVASQEIHAWKPHRLAFERATDKLHFPRASTLYIGDSPETDVLGAQRAGLLSGWANFQGLRYPPNLPAPDVILSKWDDLLTLLP